MIKNLNPELFETDNIDEILLNEKEIQEILDFCKSKKKLGLLVCSNKEVSNETSAFVNVVSSLVKSTRRAFDDVFEQGQGVSVDDLKGEAQLLISLINRYKELASLDFKFKILVVSSNGIEEVKLGGGE